MVIEALNLLNDDIPAGWFVLWCPSCLTSLAWTMEDFQSYDFESWGEVQFFCMGNVDHQPHQRR